MYKNDQFLALLRSMTGAATDKALAERIGVSRGKVSAWSGGTLHPTIGVFAKILDALGQRAAIELFLAALADASTSEKKARAADISGVSPPTVVARKAYRQNSGEKRA